MLEFRTLLEQAMRLRALALVDEIVDIADEAVECTTMVGLAAAQTRINTRKWLAEKLARELYGKEMTIRNETTVTHRHELVQKVMAMVQSKEKATDAAFVPIPEPVSTAVN